MTDDGDDGDDHDNDDNNRGDDDQDDANEVTGMMTMTIMMNEDEDEDGDDADVDIDGEWCQTTIHAASGDEDMEVDGQIFVQNLCQIEIQRLPEYMSEIIQKWLPDRNADDMSDRSWKCSLSCISTYMTYSSAAYKDFEWDETMTKRSNASPLDEGFAKLSLKLIFITRIEARLHLCTAHDLHLYDQQ